MSDNQAQPTDDLEEDLSGLVSRSAAAVESHAPEAQPQGLPPQLAALVRGIEPDGLREFTSCVFADISRLLGGVEAVRRAAANGCSLEGLLRVIAALKKSSGYLLTNIETAELRVEGMPGALTETLEAAGFALRHELRRAFEQELAGRDGARPGRQDVLRGCALLENCFQQLTVSLARAFDAGVTGAALFENYRRRREESLALRGELRELLGEVRRVEKGYSIFSSLSLLNRVRRFRRECLHYLMYRDWEEFERFADALELCYDSEGEMRVLLNKLSCYVETLLGQVAMRAVLAEG